MSPYVKHGLVSHTHYDQVSMLRTMELILNLSPMSMYDTDHPAHVRYLFRRPDLTNYRALPPNITGAAKTAALHPELVALSAKLDFSHPDIDSQDEALE